MGLIFDILFFLSFVSIAVGIVLLLVRAIFKKGMSFKKLSILLASSLVVFIISGIFMPELTPEEKAQLEEGKQGKERAVATKLETEKKEEKKVNLKNEKEQKKDEEKTIILKQTEGNEKFRDFVTTFESPEIVYKNQSIKLVGVDFGKQGIPNIMGIQDVDPGQLGSFSALQGKHRDDKRDSELILFFEMKSKEKIEPRSEIKATLPQITVIDDQGDKAKQIAKVPNKNKEVYYKKGEDVFGVVGYAVYSDTKEFKVNIGQSTLVIKDLKYRTESEF